MTKSRLSAGYLVVTLGMLGAAWSVATDGVARGGELSLNDLSMEVAALHACHQLQLTPTQLETLRTLAKKTAPKSSGRDTATASADFRRTLIALRDALIQEDDELIDQPQEELDDLRDHEKPELEES